MALLHGDTTARANAAPTAASTAVPPAFRIANPPSEAAGCGVTTTPASTLVRIDKEPPDSASRDQSFLSSHLLRLNKRQTLNPSIDAIRIILCQASVRSRIIVTRRSYGQQKPNRDQSEGGRKI